jgi:enterochelin esterase family protein
MDRFLQVSRGGVAPPLPIPHRWHEGGATPPLRATILLVLLLFLVPAVAYAETPPEAFFDRTGRVSLTPFETLAELRSALAGAKTAPQVDAVWQEVVSLGQMPLVFGDTAAFLWRGKASSVAWVGDFTTWRAGDPLTGKRLTGDVWLATAKFPLDARFDYKVRVDGRERLDPLNPLRQLGMYGYNSVVTMPQYFPSAWTDARVSVAKGRLSEPFVIESKKLGYAKRFTVYTPSGVEKLRNLPVLYVTDGHEFGNPEMGALPTILDNLLAEGRIRPVIAVFVDPRDVATGENKRGPELLTNPRFQWFLTEELIPWIDARYPTRPLPEARALAGMSLGGLHATYTAMRQPNYFGLIGALSPYYLAKPAVLAEVEKSPRQPVKLFVSQGTYDYDVDNTRHLRDVLKAKGYSFRYLEANDGHSWGNWRNILDDMVTYFFGK